jgi:hypothetical protein
MRSWKHTLLLALLTGFVSVTCLSQTPLSAVTAYVFRGGNPTQTSEANLGKGDYSHYIILNNLSGLWVKGQNRLHFETSFDQDAHMMTLLVWNPINGDTLQIKASGSHRQGRLALWCRVNGGLKIRSVVAEGNLNMSFRGVFNQAARNQLHYDLAHSSFVKLLPMVLEDLSQLKFSRFSMVTNTLLLATRGAFSKGTIYRNFLKLPRSPEDGPNTMYRDPIGKYVNCLASSCSTCGGSWDGTTCWTDPLYTLVGAGEAACYTVDVELCFLQLPIPKGGK